MNTSQPIVLFDGVCNFCNNMVNFAIRNDKKGRLKFAALQSETGKNLLAAYGVSPIADTVVFIENGKVYTYASAAIHISRYLKWPTKMLYVFIIIPPFITQPFYKWFAKRRYKWFGKKETCMIPTKEVRERFLD